MRWTAVKFSRPNVGILRYFCSGRNAAVTAKIETACTHPAPCKWQGVRDRRPCNHKQPSFSIFVWLPHSLGLPLIYHPHSCLCLLCCIRSPNSCAACTPGTVVALLCTGICQSPKSSQSSSLLLCWCTGLWLSSAAFLLCFLYLYCSSWVMDENVICGKA